MKTSKIKTVRNIGRIRTLLVTLSVAVCLATLMGCGNAPEKDTSPADDIERLRLDSHERLPITPRKRLRTSRARTEW